MLMNKIQAQCSGNMISQDASAATSSSSGFFSRACNFQVNKSQFINNDFSQNTYRATTCLEYLRQFISEDALHDSNARFPPPMCHPMTREKVLRIITDWVNDTSPHRRVIWLNGAAGAGKSAIAQTIAERCSDEQLAASFFFLRNSSDRGTATRLFTTLAWQLAKNIPELHWYIESAMEVEPLLPTKSIDIQFNRLIVRPFEDLLHDKPNFCPQKSLIIIDGVDECASDRDQLLFLTLIGDALFYNQIPLHFLICSRPEAHIRDVFESEVMTKVADPVPLDYRFKADDDIQRYLEDEFARISAEHRLLTRDWPSEEVIDQLVSKSSGQFIYASTVIKFVDDTDAGPETQLDIVLKTRAAHVSLPFAELDRLYIQILSQQPDTRLLRNLFTLIIAFRNPSAAFVCQRLRILEEELERKLRRLRSLVRISPLGIGTYHVSLHEFFLDKKRAGKYFIHPAWVTFVRPRLALRLTVGVVELGIWPMLGFTGGGCAPWPSVWGEYLIFDTMLLLEYVRPLENDIMTQFFGTPPTWILRFLDVLNVLRWCHITLLLMTNLEGSEIFRILWYFTFIRYLVLFTLRFCLDLARKGRVGVDMKQITCELVWMCERSDTDCSSEDARISYI